MGAERDSFFKKGQIRARSECSAGSRRPWADREFIGWLVVVNEEKIRVGEREGGQGPEVPRYFFFDRCL